MPQLRYTDICLVKGKRKADESLALAEKTATSVYAMQYDLISGTVDTRNPPAWS